MSSKIFPKEKSPPPGIYCPVISLYKPTNRQEIDLDASFKFFTYLINSAIDGLVLAGTTAEAALLSADERTDLIQVARKAAVESGRPKFPIVAGISAQSTNETIRLAQSALDAGADYGLLLPPNYWPKAVSTDIIAEFYREVADATPLPIVIYSFPAVCNGIDMSSDLLADLAEHPNIVGVKLTCGNAGKVTRLTNRYSHDQFAVYAGSSDWLTPCLSGGGSGCVTGIANVFPKTVAHLYALWKTGEESEARRLQGVVAEAEKACKEGIASTKYATAYFLGSKAGVEDERAFWPRKPYRAVGEEKRRWVVEAMGHLEVVEGEL